MWPSINDIMLFFISFLFVLIPPIFRSVSPRTVMQEYFLEKFLNFRILNQILNKCQNKILDKISYDSPYLGKYSLKFYSMFFCKKGRYVHIFSSKRLPPRTMICGNVSSGLVEHVATLVEGG